MGANLYELMDDFKGLMAIVDDEGLTDAQLSELLTEMEERKGPLRDKVDNICRLLTNIASDIESYKAEEHRLAARRKTLENREDRLRSWIRNSMDILSVDKMKTSVHNVTLGKGQKRVVVLNENELPDAYVEVTRKPKKKDILKAYSDHGEIVAGCDIVDGERKLIIR